MIKKIKSIRFDSDSGCYLTDRTTLCESCTGASYHEDRSIFPFRPAAEAQVLNTS